MKEDKLALIKVVHDSHHFSTLKQESDFKFHYHLEFVFASKP